MAEQKGIGSKLLGLFVETGEGQPGSEDTEASSGREKSAAELVAELAGQTGPGAAGAKRPAQGTPGKAAVPPSAAAPTGPALDLSKAPVAAAPGAPVDFDAIFKAAGMDAAELDRVKKAEDLLKSLPEATPQPVKKQIVEAALKAFGFEIEKIVQAAQNQKRAIDTYVRLNETATAKAIQDAETQIRVLNEKIAGLRSDIEKRTGGLGSLSTSAQARKGEVQKVIEFFQPPTPGSTTP